jgi:hypothetical protein
MLHTMSRSVAVESALASYILPVINTSEALAEFDRQLTVAGFDADRPDARIAWRVFKEFASVEVACADDALLFQVGVYAFTGERRFHLDFTRQFTHDEDGEYAGMEQLHCTLYYEPVGDLLALDGTLWSYGFDSRESFFTQVEAMPEFQIPSHRHAPLRAEIDQENV